MATIPPNVTAEDAYRLGQLLLFGQFMYGIGLWELIICAVGTPVNAVVLYIAIWLSKKGSSGNGGKQQWFVASMTAADLLFCSIHSPMFYALYTLGQRFDSGSCSLFYIISHISVVASSLSLLLINVDKFLALHKPLHYPSLMTTRRVWATLVCFWLVSIAWASFLVFGPFLSISNNCGPIFKPEYRILYYIFAVIFFALPVCASVFIAVFVIGIARRSRTPNLLVRSAGTGNGLASKWLLELHMASSNVETNSQKQRQVHQERRKNVKAITFVVTTTLWSAVTLLPYRFALIGNWMGYGGVVWPSIFLALTTMNALGKQKDDFDRTLKKATFASVSRKSFHHNSYAKAISKTS